MMATRKTKPTDETPIPIDRNDPEAPTTLDFEESPAPIVEKNSFDRAWDTVKEGLGISTDTSKKGKDKTPRPLSGKLNARQQRFVDAATPTLALGFMTLATAVWSKIGPEYSELGPDEEVASRIVAPLLRIYARHNDFLVNVNPDVADLGVFLFALVGYINVSLKLYAEIKEKKEYYEQNGHYSDGYYRPGNAPTAENGTGNAGSRRNDVRRQGREDASTNGANVRDREDLDSSSLSKEEQQHQALLRLSQLDYQHRARRSGRS